MYGGIRSLNVDFTPNRDRLKMEQPDSIIKPPTAKLYQAQCMADMTILSIGGETLTERFPVLSTRVGHCCGCLEAFCAYISFEGKQEENHHPGSEQLAVILLALETALLDL